MSGEPAQIAQSLSAAGAKHVYVDGGLTNQEFLRAGQIHDLTITRVPVLIGMAFLCSDACQKTSSSGTLVPVSTKVAS
jgi:riboflavin biosynthesis pyrimidine reductase